MRPGGTLDAAALERLRAVLLEARERGLVVDVTFTAEHIRGLTRQTYTDALVRATEALREYRNALFDLENERNLHGPGNRPLDAAAIVAMVAAVKRADPARIVTASTSQDVPPQRAAQFARDAHLDVTAYHDPRVRDWYRDEQVASVAERLTSGPFPVYFQEPARYPNPSTDRAEYFVQARAAAARAGVAAWCFHTDLGFDLRTQRFELKLRSRPEPDWAFVDALQSRSQVPKLRLP
jgi:hypothetical protein